MKTRTHSLKETYTLAASFVDELLKMSIQPSVSSRKTKAQKKEKHALIVGCYGDLGSGKTTFIKGVAKALGIKDVITSPTFVIEKIYKLKQNSPFSHLIHIDAYRLETGKELLTLGWKTIESDPHSLIFIEWPERVAEVLPKNIRKLKFKFINETTREISI